MRECLAHLSTNGSKAFSRVIGLTNRPLSKEDSLLATGDKRWDLHSGMDLERDVDAVAEKLKAIEGIDQVSYVYFTCESGLAVTRRRANNTNTRARQPTRPMVKTTRLSNAPMLQSFPTPSKP